MTHLGFKLRQIQQKWNLKTSGEVTFEEFAQKANELHKDIKSFDHKIRNQVDAAEGLQQVHRNKSKEVDSLPIVYRRLDWTRPEIIIL